MNMIDRAVRYLSPESALKRAHARQVLNSYEGAKPSRLRKPRGDRKSPDLTVQEAAERMRYFGRWLEENYDLVTGAFDVLVARTVGRGFSTEPMVRNLAGELHEDFNRQIRDLFEDWAKKPEVTGEYSWSEAQRLAARTYFRDGECFAQKISGTRSDINHLTLVPFSIEMIEPDFVPFDYNDVSKSIVQGIQKNAWGRPTNYFVYRNDPRESYAADTKAIPADAMVHLKLTRRIRQTRGVTIMHSVMNRIDDVRDYEEAERVAARISAAMTIYIKKGSPEFYDSTPPVFGDEDVKEKGFRDFEIAPGMLFDDLRPGEEVGTIQSNRPSSLLLPFRNAMLKAIASGIGASYSSLAKDYSGTYSSQRQELVEQQEHNEILQDKFSNNFIQPIYEQFIKIAIASNLLILPKDVATNSLYRARHKGPSMPWIDPIKESNALLIDTQAGFRSRDEVIRSRGGNPQDTDSEIAKAKKRAESLGLFFTSDAAQKTPAPFENNASENNSSTDDEEEKVLTDEEKENEKE